MKKIILFTAILMCSCGILFAQEQDPKASPNAGASIDTTIVKVTEKIADSIYVVKVTTRFDDGSKNVYSGPEMTKSEAVKWFKDAIRTLRTQRKRIKDRMKNRIAPLTSTIEEYKAKLTALQETIPDPGEGEEN